MSKELVEEMSKAIWSARRDTYAVLGVTGEPLLDWPHEQDVTRDAVRREATAALMAFHRWILSL